ncbi:MAG: glycine cleavage system protein H [Acidobacteriia bacterium]|nr:glycine cleavage system protein H [Terriglobia bacterium]
MSEYLQTTVDKFTFRVAKDRLYTPNGLWVMFVQAQGPPRLRIGITDFLQQHSGDVAFVTARPQGTNLKAGDEFADMETMKITLGLPSPITGTIVEISPALELKPEVVNQDPYGEGWMAVIEATDWEADRAQLLEAPAYLEVMKALAEKELES